MLTLETKQALMAQGLNLKEIYLLKEKISRCHLSEELHRRLENDLSVIEFVIDSPCIGDYTIIFSQIDPEPLCSGTTKLRAVISYIDYRVKLCYPESVA